MVLVLLPIVQTFLGLQTGIHVYAIYVNMNRLILQHSMNLWMVTSIRLKLMTMTEQTKGQGWKSTRYSIFTTIV